MNNDPNSLACRKEPGWGRPVFLVRSMCGTQHAYIWEHPENGWEIYRLCYPVENGQLIGHGERLVVTEGRTVPGYRRVADVRVSHP